MIGEEELKVGDVALIATYSIGRGHTCPVLEVRNKIVLLDLSATPFGGRAWYFKEELQKAPIKEVA